MRDFIQRPPVISDATESSDDVIRAVRERREEQIENCSRHAANRILAKIPRGSHLSEATLAELIAGEQNYLAKDCRG